MLIKNRFNRILSGLTFLTLIFERYSLKKRINNGRWLNLVQKYLMMFTKVPIKEMKPLLPTLKILNSNSNTILKPLLFHYPSIQLLCRSFKF